MELLVFVTISLRWGPLSMSCNYSILYSGHRLSDHYGQISSYLTQGIKVFWFGSEQDCSHLNNTFVDHRRHLLLQCFVCPFFDEFIIIDGQQSSITEKLQRLSSQVPNFNYEQYIIEHSTSEHQIIKASAGTGKTSVMIDRVMYLLHTVPELKLSQISMITFTNDAADQMNQRLQDALLIRYNLTHNPFYLDLLEQQSQMNISTIHSFAYGLLKSLGLQLGYTRQLAIRSFKYKLDGIISDIIDKQIDPSKLVRDQITVPLHLAKSTIYNYWFRLVEIGFSHEDIQSLDWGYGKDDRSKLFQQLLTSTIPLIDDYYDELKEKSNSVSLIDILRDLDCVLTPDNDSLHNIDIKYLFVDEFQDSDNSQISVIAKLASLLNLSLFVVGDIKQSIYRFRGADDTAFSTFLEKMGENDCVAPVEYYLVNNYRTAPEIMNRLHTCFLTLGRQGLLEYDAPSQPCRNIEGKVVVKEFNQFKDPLEQLVIDLKESLIDLNSRIDRNSVKPSDKVVILSRTNRMLLVASQVCKQNGIPVVVQQEGSFYISDAVRDFYSLISSFLFHDRLHLFNYLISPYSSLHDPIDLNDIIKSEKDDLSSLNSYISKTNWSIYDSRIHELPLLTVIKQIIDSEPIIHNYSAILKRNYLEKGMTVDAVNRQCYADCRQYRADLDKLLEILQQKISSERCDLYDIYSFLQLMIDTNRTESCADINDDFDSSYVYCMTVHKAKGLEFDTVYLPFTNGSFRLQENEDIIVSDDSKVGWKLYSDDYRLINSYYDNIHKGEILSIRAEECRILYVALTRAIKNLVIYVKQDFKNNTWSDLLNRGGLF